MSIANLRSITNHFLDVRLVSLASWRQANEILPRDRGGPYVVLQEGYDPEDLKMIPDEFVLGRSGKWLSLGYFFRMPVPERRAEFVFGTAAEAVIFRPGDAAGAAPATAETDEMAAAFQAAKNQDSGKT
jgi:hypothetical protein